jgi:hypothetical protein
MRLGNWFLIGCAGLLAAGCAGYKVGPTNGLGAGDKSVQVVPFSNQTIEPRLGDALTGAVRKQLQRDGTFRLTTREVGDLLVKGEITRYERSEQTLARDDMSAAQDYRISMTAHVVATDRASGKVLLDQPVSGSTLIHFESDLPSAEREALPLLATDLARNITALLADGSW